MNDNWEFWLVFTLFALVGLIIYVMNGAANKEKKKEENYTKDNIKECLKYIQKAIPGKQIAYNPDSEVYYKFQKNFIDEYNVTALAIDILKHCNVNPKELFVKINFVGANYDKSILYKIQGINNIIPISYRTSTNKNDILAILIRECVYIYLRENNYFTTDCIKNEILTDMATVKLGFYEYAESGYRRISFLSQKDLDYIKTILNTINNINP